MKRSSISSAIGRSATTRNSIAGSANQNTNALSPSTARSGSNPPRAPKKPQNTSPNTGSVTSRTVHMASRPARAVSGRDHDAQRADVRRQALRARHEQRAHAADGARVVAAGLFEPAGVLRQCKLQQAAQLRGEGDLL